MTAPTIQPSQFATLASDDGFTLSALERDGQIWFIASDVCAALDIKNSRDAVAKLDAYQKGVATTDTLGGRQEVTVINEAGLYELAFKSRKESAKEFRRWVTSDVLPNIRKHGGYISGMEKLKDPSEAQARISAEAERVRKERQAEHLEARYNAFQIMRRSGSVGRRR